jgi:hypothetical protein
LAHVFWLNMMLLLSNCGERGIRYCRIQKWWGDRHSAITENFLCESLE